MRGFAVGVVAALGASACGEHVAGTPVDADASAAADGGFAACAPCELPACGVIDEVITGIQVGGPAASRPFFAVSGANRAAADALIASFTEAEWVRLVPTQSPRQQGPTCPNGGAFSWDPDDPDRIRCGTTVYDPARPDRFVTVEVLGGATVRLPAWNTPSGGLTYLQARIDYEKWAFWDNRLPMLGATYQSTGDERYARRVILLLDQWADNFPRWYLSRVNDDDPITPAEAAAIDWWPISRASPWNNLAREIHEGSVEAFDRVFDSPSWGELSAERGYDVKQRVIDRYFRDELRFLMDTVPLSVHTRTNLSGTYTRMAQLAVILGRTDVIEWYDRYWALSVENLKRDGMFPESFSYHHQYIRDNLRGADHVLRFFEVWPPANDLAARLRARRAASTAPFERGLAASALVASPEGYLAPFGDTHLEGPDRGVPTRQTTTSQLLPGYGHAMLGAGAGDQQVQVNFSWNDRANHTQKDVLHFTFYAHERELLSDIRYSRVPGREFTNSTMAHNTVVIDRSEQYRSNHEGQTDAGHLFTNGSLLLFEPDLGDVAVAEVDGARAYTNVGAERYQRTLVLDAGDPAHPYVVDIVRVRGGDTHDYFLHGATLFEQTRTSSLAMTPQPRWGSCDPDGNWYGAFRNLTAAASPGTWHVTLAEANGTRDARVFGADAGDVTVFLGESPSPYRAPNDITTGFCTDRFRPSLVVRHHDGDSLFTTVTEAYDGTPAIARVERVPLTVDDLDHVGLRITFADGHVGLVLADLTNAAPSARATGPAFGTADGRYQLEGRLGIVSSTGDARLVAGTRFVYPGGELTQDVAVHEGTISGVVRRAGGCSYDALVTDTELPAGDALRGRWIRLVFDTYQVVGSDTLQHGFTELHQIDRIERDGGTTHIVLVQDPEIVIAGDVTVESARPHRTMRGLVRFEIPLASRR